MNQTKHLQEIKNAIINFVANVDLSQLKTDLDGILTETSDTAVNTADIITNTSTIITNTGNVATNTTGIPSVIHTTSTLTDAYNPGTTKCVVMAGAQLDSKLCPITLTNTGNIASDIVKVQGTNLSVNSGNKDAGCIRMVAATDDVNLSSINTKMSVISGNQLNTVTNAHAIVVGTRDSVTNGQCSLGVGLQRQDFASSAGANVFLATGAGNISAAPTYSADAVDAYATIRVTIATDDDNLAAIRTSIAHIDTILTDIWDSVNHRIGTHNT